MFKEETIENTILYFLNKNKDKVMDKLKLMKLIWLSDRISLNKQARTITGDDYSAMPLGPVPSTTYNTVKESNDSFKIVGNDKSLIKSNKEHEIDYFSESDIEIMDYVYDNFNSKDSYNLSQISHKFPEWKRFEDVLNDKSRPNSFPIDINDFFRPVEINNFSDIYSENLSVMSKDDYLSSKAIKAILTA